MHRLIVQRNMTKNAAEEDGPSFEQQFGILANAVISDKFPQLDSMKLAFQLIDKTDDNTKACGASVYVVGKTVIFVPAFFRNGQLKTGDMMLIGETQTFLPMSDPWLAWIKNKDLVPSGELIPADEMDPIGNTKGTTIREIADPIIKTASVFLKGLCKLDPDLTKTASQMNVLDTTLHMGKQATESMLDNLVKPDLLNAALSFYKPEDLQKFAMAANDMVPAPAVQVIMPFDKEAKELKSNELNALYKDGFFIKCAKETPAPKVMRKTKVNNLFGMLKEPGKTGLLQPDGTIKEVYIVKENYAGDSAYCWDCNSKGGNSYTSDHDGFMPPRPFSSSEPRFKIITADKVCDAKGGAMELLADRKDFSDDVLSEIGTALKGSGDHKDGVYLIFPDGSCMRKYDLTKGKDNTWTHFDQTIQLAEDDSTLRKPLPVSDGLLIVPNKTRVVSGDDLSSIPVVTMATLDAFLENFTAKHYNKARIYNNGSDYTVSGSNTTDGDKPLSFKEACLALVNDYGVAPADAKIMLKDASNGATYDNPKSTSYLIEKTASIDGGWQDANIPMDQHINQPPQISQREMPTFLEDPAQLEQAVTNAAQQGIKEVFDVTVLKLLVKQNRFFDEIQEDLPVFMQVLDSLCRKLFQFYWHTEKMEEKYGMVKLKSLEESLKVTMESLSELTIFFKLRTVDGTGSTGDTLGELMTGQML